jgi:PA domain
MPLDTIVVALLVLWAVPLALWSPCIEAAGASAVYRGYEANCTIHRPDEPYDIPVPCIAGLSVDYSFQLSRARLFLPSRDSGNALMCSKWTDATILRDGDDTAVLAVKRGQCTFGEKLLHAKEAGASAVVIVNTDGDAFPVGIDPSSVASGLPPVVMISAGYGHHFEPSGGLCGVDHQGMGYISGQCGTLYVEGSISISYVASKLSVLSVPNVSRICGKYLSLNVQYVYGPLL